MRRPEGWLGRMINRGFRDKIIIFLFLFFRPRGTQWANAASVFRLDIMPDHVHRSVVFIVERTT